MDVAATARPLGPSSTTSRIPGAILDSGPINLPFLAAAAGPEPHSGHFSARKRALEPEISDVCQKTCCESTLKIHKDETMRYERCFLRVPSGGLLVDACVMLSRPDRNSN
ncbi:hypothetical protein TcasGA2_TC011364 [Tribolium castaneum]|uniref:Uncharacterized protein n=1 Tax=Tribolium castaneum TaxID=7070 RepID=D6X483_TRICA|nr:hypothetical protein TcasGA2_TC011364 [Tribolium castaneum]